MSYAIYIVAIEDDDATDEKIYDLGADNVEVKYGIETGAEAIDLSAQLAQVLREGGVWE